MTTPPEPDAPAAAPGGDAGVQPGGRAAPGTPLELAIVGHTNTGKTSVLRSLLRNRGVGDVADEAGTTRDATAWPMTVGGRLVAQLWDTPGLERAGELLYQVRGIQQQEGIDGPTALQRIVETNAFESAQDLRPLRTLAHCHAGLLVFDVREPPRRKYWEEHELMQLCGAPLVAILNCAGEGDADAWDTALRGQGLHAIVRYDAWAADEQDAQKLFGKIAELVGPQRADAIRSLATARRAEEAERVRASARALAALLTDLAAFERVVPTQAAAGDADAAEEQVRLETQRAIAEGYQTGWTRFVRRLTEIWGLSAEQIRSAELELGKAAGDDLEALAKVAGGVAGGSVIGIIGAAAAAGAVKGVALDAVAGGTTLGAGVVGGAAIGVALGGRRAVRRVVRKVKRERTLEIDPGTTLTTLRRGVWLIERLRRYGAASERPLEIDASTEDEPRFAAAAKLVKHAHTHGSPAWSQLDPETRTAAESPVRPEPSRKHIARLTEAIDTAVHAERR